MISPNTQHFGTQSPKIAVFVDFSGGTLDDFSKGILTEASRLAGEVNGEWSVLGFGALQAETLTALASYGVDRVLHIDCHAKLLDSVEDQARLLAQAAEQEAASILLLPHNDLGDTLAPMLAHALEAALFCEAVAYTASGAAGPGLILARRALGAQVVENKYWNGEQRLVLTASRDILSGVVLPSVKKGKVKTESWQGPAVTSAAKTKIVERIPADPQTVDLVDAEVIISAGLGCDDETITQVRELARLLNASLGVTRPAYDLGYADFSRMVGQTGKSVAPEFYLALGISGSMHHVGGIKDSKRIIAVNLDPKAPIIPNSDEAFVADLREVLPLLIERVKAATGGSL